MPKMTFISVGDVVVPKLKQGMNKLVLWSEGNNPSSVIAEIDKNELLTVIRVESFETKKDVIQAEWSKSACLLLSCKGELGWTGIGWIRKVITTDS